MERQVPEGAAIILLAVGALSGALFVFVAVMVLSWTAR